MGLLEYESVRKWASRIKFSRSYEYVLQDFINWIRENHQNYAEITADGLIELQKNPLDGDQYHVLDMVQDFIREKNNRYGTKNTYYKQLRSFFLHNRAMLPKDPSFNVRGDTPPVNGGLSPEEVREVLLSSNKMHRAVFLCMLQGSLDLDMITYWNMNGWESLREQLTQNMDPIKLDLPGRKSMKFQRPYYTFITTDAIKALRDYLPKQLPTERAAIFQNQRGLPISKVGVADYWKRHLKRTANVNHVTAEEADGRPGTIRYGKNIHELRDTFKTLTAKTAMKYEVAEYFMGHTVDKLGYDKSSTDEPYYRRQYMEASEHLNILSKAKAYGLMELEEAENEKIMGLRKENEKLRQKLEDNENMAVKALEAINQLRREMDDLKTSQEARGREN